MLKLSGLCTSDSSVTCTDMIETLVRKEVSAKLLCCLSFSANSSLHIALEVVTRLTYIAAGSVSTWYKGSPPEGGCASGTGYQAFIAADGTCVTR
jgi:hypothetical protein